MQLYVAGRMSDQDQHVRLMATHCFATLIQLMPLDGGVPDPPNLTSELTKQKARERKFLEQLFNPKSIVNYKVPIPIQAELRSYQQVRKCFDRFTSCTVIMKTTVVQWCPYIHR
jgi:TATA-binding protein-associated factor